jgi:oligopeptide/dipeptide ABC transporter ATP-binding protein
MHLAVDDLVVGFRTPRGGIRALNGVGFNVMPGEAVGIVGESGSGKSVTALSILRLLARSADVESGRIRFEDRDLTAITREEMRTVRGCRIGMVFQNPMSSLNPVLTIGRQITEGLRAHRGTADGEATEEAARLLHVVGIADPKRTLRAFPHQLSGGMRQRAMIAMAVSCEPSLLIADEPTTALDVTVQAQILQLFRDLRARTRMALVLITHDLGVIAGIADRVVVMYAGRVVETGPAIDVLETPLHPYTQGLVDSIPRLDGPRGQSLQPIPGDPPDPTHPLGGCAFRDRCTRADQRCLDRPALVERPDGRSVACWHAPVTPRGRQ